MIVALLSATGLPLHFKHNVCLGLVLGVIKTMHF